MINIIANEKNRKIPSGLMIVVIPETRNDRLNNLLEVLKKNKRDKTKNSKNSGYVVPYNEFSINLGAKAKRLTAIMLYFFSTNRLHKKYNGNMVMLESTMLEIFCICI